MENESTRAAQPTRTLDEPQLRKFRSCSPVRESTRTALPVRDPDATANEPQPEDFSSCAQLRETTRTTLPVCILAAAEGEQPTVVCLRMNVPGQLESQFIVERGLASALCRRGDRVEAMDAMPVDALTVEEILGEAADGALLVAWDLDAVAALLRTYHPAPERMLARAVVELDLRAAALLAGIGIENIEPTIDGLAELLSLSPPSESAIEQAWFVSRAVRRLASSATWLGRVLALGFDERSILGTCVERLAAGAATYGTWNVDDGRDYAKEAYEEVIDGLHYAAAGLLKLQDRTQRTEVA